ncbi:hypothetical protein C0991_006135, partial [Blastosporella zonata]
SPQLLLQSAGEIRPASSLNAPPDRILYTVDVSDSESDADIETLTTAMDLVTFTN